MREIYAKHESFGLKSGDIVTVHLLNSVGMVSNLHYDIQEEVTCGSDALTFSVVENDKIAFESYYKITLPNTLTFTFTVQTSEQTVPHELKSLTTMGCFEELFKDEKLIDSFTEKLELFFTGENPHFTTKEQRLFELYAFYADEVISDGVATVDVATKMDTYLSSVGE